MDCGGRCLRFERPAVGGEGVLVNEMSVKKISSGEILFAAMIIKRA